MLQRSIMIAALMLLATSAAAGWTLPCLFSGCSITFVSPEYAAKPVQPLDPEAALAQSTPTGRRMGGSRLSSMSVFPAPPPLNPRPRPGAAASVTMGPMDRSPCTAPRVLAIIAKIASENVASGQKSFSDVMRSWEGSSGHRENLLRPEVTAIGVAMAKNSSGRPYWTLVLGAEKANAKKDTEELSQDGQGRRTRAASTAH